MGRQSAETQKHRQQCVDLVCGAIATSDKGIKRICDAFRDQDKTFPAASTVMLWVAEDKGIAEQYACAKARQAEYLAEQIIEIADDSSEDELFTEDGKRVLNNEFVQRSKLRVDARKWIASKLLPKKYGDRITQEIEISDSLADAMKAARERANAAK